VLFWNMDATRMPQAMHSYYLRQMYLHNRLIEPDALTIADEPINLGRITQPLYAVTARTTTLRPGRVATRFAGWCTRMHRCVLCCPPPGTFWASSTRRWIRPSARTGLASPRRSKSPQDWLAKRQDAGSWWGDWTAWLNARTGDMVPAYGAGRRKFPALADAPGTYVLEK
jgi:polyhydroxyalkanoate synthase